MKRFSEQYFAVNIARFEAAISICKQCQNEYQPAQKNIEFSRLNSLSIAVNQGLHYLERAKLELMYIREDRDNFFLFLKKQIISLINDLKNKDLTKSSGDLLETLLLELEARRINSKVFVRKQNLLQAAVGRKIGISQGSYKFFVESLKTLIEIVQRESIFLHSIEKEKNVAELNSLLTKLITINSAVIQLRSVYRVIFDTQKRMIFADYFGLEAVVREMEEYFKYEFGTNSKQWKQISNILSSRLQ
jgi:hypothetical protein